MTRKLFKEKGQMSFDLAFAIILALAVYGMLAGYWSASRQSVEDGRRLMALNVLADYTQGNLNAFYNSLVGGGNATYSLKFPGDGLFDAGVEDTNYYSLPLKYTVGFADTTMTFTDSLDPSTTQRHVERDLGFGITKSAGGSACIPASSIATGGNLTLTDCWVNSGLLTCVSCT